MSGKSNKIVILDAWATVPGDISWEPIAQMGELTIYDRTPPELIAERIGDANIVISSKVIIGRGVFEKCPNLEYIGLLSGRRGCQMRQKPPSSLSHLGGAAAK